MDLLSDQQKLVIKVLKGMMIASLLLLGAIPTLIPDEVSATVVKLVAPEGTGGAFAIALSFVSGLTIVGGWLVPRISDEKLRAVFESGPDAERGLQLAIARLHTFYIIRLSAFESVGLFGLFISLGTGERLWWIVMASVALLCLLLAKFGVEQLERVVVEG